MPENTTPPNGETPNGTSPQGETPNTSGTGETPGTTPASIDAALKEIESLKAALKKTNNESKTHRLKADELDKLKAELEASKLSETERLQKQYNDLQSQHNEITLQLREERSINTLERIGRSLGITDAIALEDAVNLALGKLEHDDQGKPTNADDVMKQLVKSRPWLTSGKAPASAGGATNPSRAQSNASGELSWEVITKMTQEQYNARRDEIQRWMRTAPMKQY